MMAARCCLCRLREGLVRSQLPGSGWRCRGRRACAGRVQHIVEAYRGLARACEQPVDQSWSPDRLSDAEWAVLADPDLHRQTVTGLAEFQRGEQVSSDWLSSGTVGA